MASIPDILESVSLVVAQARHVHIDSDAVQRWAEQHVGRIVTGTHDDRDLLFRGSPDDCANFVLLTDALNFCFWADEPWEVDYRDRTWTRTLAMIAALLRAIDKDPSWLTAERWAAATRADVDDVFGGKGAIPLPDKRVAVLVETGTILRDRFDGRFTEVVACADRRADGVVLLLADSFPSFRDVAQYHGPSHGRGQTVAFLKRAQICAADLHRLWTANGYPGLMNMDRLTVFADYRLPQLFRHEGMLRIGEELAGRIDRDELIESGSDEEIELRAATVWIGRLLCQAMAELGCDVAAWQLDYDLWLRARSPDVTVPHHRTITHYY